MLSQILSKIPILATFAENFIPIMVSPLSFDKYQGAGNDFIMIDNFSGQYDDLSLDWVRKMCNRRFGVGADGLILLNKLQEGDFEMDYYNADGSKSFCGNGARCAVAFAHFLRPNADSTYRFLAIDGWHNGWVLPEKEVKIAMGDVTEVKNLGDLTLEIHTGSPHYIQFDKSIDGKNIVELGRNIRNSKTYEKEGINVNWVEILEPHHLKIRTYERGVEDETYACGTGVTAAAIGFHYKFLGHEGFHFIDISAKGGALMVSFHFSEESGYKEVYLHGPAEKVFDGSYSF